jgi:predicted unusual protein kinase regulating ubiquinone biosynthesis (AarF/ABC1/UbiB family)
MMARAWEIPVGRRVVATAGVLSSEGPGFLVEAWRQPAGPVTARRLRRAFEALGPTYVKLGQLVAEPRPVRRRAGRRVRA